MKRLTTLLLALSMGFSGIAQAQSVTRRGKSVIPAKVETAYKKGLKFLAKSQNSDGSWSKTSSYKPGLTGIAVLAFLAHGEDAKNGPYAKNIQKGIEFIIKKQKSSNGYIGNSMYNHGFATLALAEAYGTVENKNIGKALKKAVSLIESAQKRNPHKAWRYSPEQQSADTTVSGCQIVALLAARNAGIPVSDKSIEAGLKYMASCRGSNGAYGYSSRGGGTTTLTAIGSLCYSLAKKKDDKAFSLSTKFLTRGTEVRGHHYNFYHEYYMAQALFHADPKLWKKWNEKNNRLMTASQLSDGSWADQRMGKEGATGFALLSMALNYRFLPIYEK